MHSWVHKHSGRGPCLTVLPIFTSIFQKTAKGFKKNHEHRKLHWTFARNINVTNHKWLQADLYKSQQKKSDELARMELLWKTIFLFWALEFLLSKLNMWGILRKASAPGMICVFNPWSSAPMAYFLIRPKSQWPTAIIRPKSQTSQTCRHAELELSRFVVIKSSALAYFLNKNMYKKYIFKEKLFTTEVQGILKGAWLVRRL
jgi:hypothetical protein